MFTTYRRRSRAGYKLTELMIAVSVLASGLAVAYPLFIGDFGLYVRNFSLNKSNNSLRNSLQQLRRDVDQAIEPPRLADFSMSGSSGVLKSVDDSTVSDQAVYMWVSLGPFYDLQPPAAGSTTPVDTTGTITLKRHIADTDSIQSQCPQVGDRLVFMNPGPLSTGMPEIIAKNSGTKIPHPGRIIKTVDLDDIKNVSDRTKDTIKITLDQTTAFGSSVKIYGNQCVCIVREVAYAAYTIKDSAGNAIERQLLYFPNTYNMSNIQVLIRDLDPNPQEESSAGVKIQPFNFTGGRGTLSALNVLLPIRALDYASSIADRNLNGKATGTASSEFNVYLRSNTNVGPKVRLD